ncbi:MAG TPA: hypothetical protein VKB78_11115 [Pirellulales bacterium]|nr:hypothetical protein [Pirellulales bacterium]
MPAFQELAGSPRVRILESGRVIAERDFHVAWDDWVELVNELRGLYMAAGTKGAALVSPACFPGNPALRVVAVSVTPLDEQSPDGDAALADLSTGMNTYASGARVRVEYGLVDTGSDRRKPPHPAGTFLRWERDVGVDMVSIPARYWKWSGGPNTILEDDLPIGVRVPVATHRLIWTNVARPPYNTIRNTRGTVNADTILGADAGCLLFVGAKIVEIYQLDGSLRYTLEYLFAEKTVPLVADPTTVVGHNYFYYGPGSGGENWFEVVSVAGGHAVYPSADFAPLFQYE